MKLKEFFQQVPRHFWLSHHPHCDAYQKHTFKIGKTKFCIGCFVGYPAGVLGVVVTTILIRTILPPAWLLYSISSVLMAAIILSFTQLTQIKAVKMLQKFCMGLGSGSFLSAFFHSGPDNMVFRWILTFFVFSAFNTVYTALHIRTHNKICDACEEGHRVGSCSGYITELEPQIPTEL